jgi:hypothetical protein
MPHCSLWSLSDWSFAFDTGVVHAAFANGDVRQAAELRLREATLGTTVQSRRHLRLRYVAADEAVSADPGVALIDDYRRLLDG